MAMEAFFADYLSKMQELHRDFIATFDGLPAEALDWVPGADMNSFCVLVVHTIGSARFWIGDLVLGEPSNRQRDLEFQARGLSAAELKARFADFEAYARSGFERVTLADLQRTHTVAVREHPITGGFAMMHALSHTGLHLGHAQITRQLWERR